MKHLEVEELITKIIGVQSLMRKPESSKIVKIMFHWTQVIVWISSPILEQHYHNLQYINSIWTVNFMKLSQKNNIELKLQDLNKPFLSRENDRFLIDDILSIIKSIPKLQRLNSCRIYLKATFLLVVSAIDGISIIKESLSGDLKTPTNTLWSRQKKLCQSSWEEWSQTTTTIYY